MASSRDDFVIAIRSAFLKKTTKQKFSLLTLIFISVFIIFLSNLNFKIINNLRSIINEIVFRSSFVVSIPENLIITSYSKIVEYSSFYDEFQLNKIQLEELRSKEISNDIIISENNELKGLIEDYSFSSNKILAKVIVDHDSPFLKTIIINKGSFDNIKIGTNIYDKNYLVGRVIEVNFKSSRVLLLSDLNSTVPISITPGNVQAIVVGDGSNSGEIKYIKDNLIEDIQNQSIAYTSGTGSIYKSGIPVGRITTDNSKFIIDFYSDFDQLKYVFVEIQQNLKIGDEKEVDDENLSAAINTEKIKLNILNEEIKILNETNEKFIEENQKLRSQINDTTDKILNLQNKIDNQNKKINQNSIDQEELSFLRQNLIYSSKCQKTVFKKGFKVGTPEYKECILSKGRKLND
ncbi:rod shape-determining protein MreC [Candidatus Pelagibacter communis]|uniref:rod shape-determining protein MreC n=1 Tax=Pelagibacter ubique TaxID=198252 RepID=UPI00094D0687|nr:rod shape-determining protein MreC [Candidatus Pelagibacter ubique]